MCGVIPSLVSRAVAILYALNVTVFWLSSTTEYTFLKLFRAGLWT